MKKILRQLCCVVFCIVSIGCTERSEKQFMVHQAVALEAADECHLCGMLITNFAGPKGQLFRQGITEADGNSVKKFCSTRDLMSFYLDPENKRNVTTILVHDMSKSPWQHPDDQYFIDARQAWFVAGSNKVGAMGKTLASFSLKTDAELFTQEFGGQVMAFTEIDYDALR